MTQKEIMILINRKIKEAKAMSNQNHGHNTEAWSSYYSGIASGLEDAKSILGMLGKPNNKVIKVTKKNEEPDDYENFLRMC